MKAIKLCYGDPDLYQTSVTSARCEFILNHFEAFMQMYKTQGSTFWLRFLVSFKSHIEEKFCNNPKWIIFLMDNFQFIKVMNFIYISLHKKFIVGSNTVIKKFVNSLITLASNSPSYLNFTCEQWLVYIKSCKQLHNVFKNFFGVLPEPSEHGGFTAFVYTVYIDFFCALTAVFEQWYTSNDLTEEELKKVDTKIIYWMPRFNRKLKPSCFEKYIADYWKEDLQRMLMTDNILSQFSAHKTIGCCDKFDKEKNIFMIFRFKDQHTLEMLKIMWNEVDSEEEDDCEESLHTITEVCMKDICILKAQAAVCTSHKKCFVKICHKESCREPFVCSGSDSCVKTCETKLKNAKKQERRSGKKEENFWKAVTVEVFPVDKKKREVSTMAESSCNREIQTYLHMRENLDLDLPLSMLKHTYHQCLAELHNLDLNPRRTECLNRLRKKLSQKHTSNSFQFNVSALRQTFYRESLFDNAVAKLEKFREHYCASKGHDIRKCNGKCFERTINTVALSTSTAFGRVILLSKTFITIPCEMACDGKADCHIEKTSVSNSSVEKLVSNKTIETKKKGKQQNTNTVGDGSCASSSNGISTVPGDSVPSNPVKKENEVSETPIKDDTDDDIDTILKLIGIGEPEDNLQASNEPDIDENCNKDSVKDDEAVENFFKLIGVQDTLSLDEENSTISQEENSYAKNAKVCAYCKKKEPYKKAFKKCSRCKEENFPVQHYYCSRDCLLEDWSESHEDEHLRFNKQLS